MSDYSPESENETTHLKKYRLNDLRKRSVSYEREQANVLRDRRREGSHSSPECSPEMTTMPANQTNVIFQGSNSNGHNGLVNLVAGI